VVTPNGAPLCAVCARPDPAFWGCCPTCGHRQLRTRSCTRCNLRQRLRVLLADHDGDNVRVELRRLHDNLVNSDRPSGVLEWLNKAGIAELLRELGTTGQRALSHAGLDELPASKPIEHLRAILVATGALPSRDEQLARLERWIARTLAEHNDPERRQLLHRYAVWHLLRRLRQRNNGAHATFSQVVKRNLNAAIALLDGLGSRGNTLAAARQADLDAWLTSRQARHRRDAGHFIRWAKRQKLTSLELPATRWRGPARTIDTEARWAQARRLLHDASINTVDRVAGLLLLLYAQTPAAISRLTLEQVQTTEQHVRLRLGHEPIALPDLLDGLVLDILARRRGHAALGTQGTSRWLFPGGHPGRPISAY
jgi:hypothetical protein